MTTVKLKRGEIRSRVSASLQNRTIDGLQVMNRHVTRWGGGGGALRIYHSMCSGFLQKQSAVSCSGGAWVIDPEEPWQVPGVQPSFVNKAYELASIYRKDNPGEYQGLAGKDLLYANQTNPYGCVGSDPWVWGAQTLYENPSATPITDDWHDPGDFCGTEPWAGNPNVPESMDDPGWRLSDGAEQWDYEWFPLVDPGAPAANIVVGGLSVGNRVGGTITHTINCEGLPLGLPEFVKNCPRGTVIHEALQEVVLGTTTWTVYKVEAANATDPVTVTTYPTTTGAFNLILMGEQRVGSHQHWAPLGGGVGGTGVSGHSAVVDATALVRRVLEVSGKGAGANTPYAHFSLLPATVANLADTTDARGVLRGLAAIPTLAYDSVAITWYPAYQEFRKLQWATPAMGNLVLTFSYPAGEVQRCVIPDFWPAVVT